MDLASHQTRFDKRLTLKEIEERERFLKQCITVEGLLRKPRKVFNPIPIIDETTDKNEIIK